MSPARLANVIQNNPADSHQIERLTRLNIADMLDNFGLGGLRYGRRLIELACRAPAQILASQVAGFDRRVGEAGLQTAAREWLLPYVNRLEISGGDRIPTDGGVIVAANHPGMTDSLACFSSIARPDLHLVSADRPFMRTMTHIARRTFFVSDQDHERLTVVRQVSRFVQQGGAVLICPAGQIEPDPAVQPGASESLETWSDSLGLFVRLAPRAVVIPAVVSGVVYGPALHHPLTRLRKSPKDRERVAATLQAFWQSTGRITPRMRVRVEFGMPLPASDLIPLGDAHLITRAITAAVRRLIERAASAATPEQAAAAAASTQPDRAYQSTQQIDLKEEAQP
ncbi:MAG TPA: 1-acyl-sn-glycerol-3-phosphate acyltransferase [Anaerolineae bacterium]|nr:1-acyl-sn-glycerol-3-phosphate acyltransferase [Anaerolineae bacterium]